MTQNKITRELLKYEIAHKIQKWLLAEVSIERGIMWRLGILLTVEGALMGPTEVCLVVTYQLEHALCCRLQPRIHPGLVNK